MTISKTSSKTYRAEDNPSTSANNDRHEQVRLFGQDPIAYSTLQDNMHYFDRSYGYIAYRRVLGMDITLGPPVCAQHDRGTMIRDFIAQSRKPIFCYLPEALLTELHDSKLYCASMGTDKHVDLDAFLQQPDKKVMGACKKAHKVDLQINPMDFAQLSDADRSRFDTISSRYLDNAQCKVEMSFINRPMSYQADGMRRGLVLSKFDREHQGPFGYAMLNPYFENAAVSGYMLDILRFEPTRLWGVWLSAVWQIAQQLQREGYNFSLGFCPLYGIRPAPALNSPWLETQLRWAVRFLSKSQYVRRLYELKSLVPGDTTQRYFVSYSRNFPRALLALLHASGIRFSYLFGPGLVRSIYAGMLEKPQGARF